MIKTKHTSRTERIFTNTMFMYLRMLLVAMVSFYTSRVILNVLGVDDYGIYNIVGSIVVFLSFFKNALNNATYRYLTYEIGRGNLECLKRIFTMCLNAHYILALFIFIILEFVGVYILNYKLNIPSDRLYAANWVLQFSLITFCFEIIKTPFESSIIAHEKMSFYAITSILEVFIKLGVVFLLQIILFDKLILYSLLLTLVSMFTLCWYYIYNKRHFPEIKYEYHWDNLMIKELLSYSGWSIVVNAADVSVTQCISVYLNLFYGVVANASMGIANQVNALISQFLNSFTTAFKPQIIKSYATNDNRYFMNLLFATSKLSFFLMFAVAFPIVINIDYILKIWLINPPEMAAIFLHCIVFYSLFDSFSSPLWTAVHATGKLKVHQILMSSIKLMNIPFGYLILYKGFPAYYIFVLYATLNGICAIVRIIYLRYLIGLDVRKYISEVISKIVIVSLLSVITPLIEFHISDFYGVKLLVLTTLSFLILYLPLIYIIGLNSSERLLVKSIINKFS